MKLILLTVVLVIAGCTDAGVFSPVSCKVMCSPNAVIRLTDKECACASKGERAQLLTSWGPVIGPERQFYEVYATRTEIEKIEKILRVKDK